MWGPVGFSGFFGRYDESTGYGGYIICILSTFLKVLALARFMQCSGWAPACVDVDSEPPLAV
eukprot:9470750-Pyramimonas_sp.AAC.3